MATAAACPRCGCQRGRGYGGGRGRCVGVQAWYVHSHVAWMKDGLPGCGLGNSDDRLALAQAGWYFVQSACGAGMGAGDVMGGRGGGEFGRRS